MYTQSEIVGLYGNSNFSFLGGGDWCPSVGGCDQHTKHGQEDLPHVQGMLAALAQEGLEELSYVEGQEGRL